MNKINNHRNSAGIPSFIQQKDISVYYSGRIDADIISGLLEKVENQVASCLCENDKKSKIISIAIELLQNAYHHCPLNMDSGKDSPAFLFHKKKNQYVFTVSNLVEKRKALLLEKRITELNQYNTTGLTNHYRNVLNNGKLSNQSAGLGWIDILRKSGNPFIINFAPRNNKYTQMTVNVAISLNR